MKISLASKHGFTLIELLVTIGIFIILMTGIAGLTKAIYSDSLQRQTALNTVDQARSVIYTFASEIRDATPGIDGAFPLNEASSTEIIFFTNYNATTANGNRVRYYISGSSLYKGVITPSGIPLKYATSSEKSSLVFSGLTSTTSLFNYYDGDFAGTSSPLTQPVNVNNVKYVAMNITAREQDVGSTTATFSITSGATIRNLKTNLGN